MKKTEERKNLIRFFVLSYVLFWALIAVTGLLVALGVPLFLQDIIKNLIAWSPTFAILILFKSLYPNTTFKAYLKSHFLSRIKVRPFLVAVLIQLGCLVIAVGAYFLICPQSLATLSFLPLQSFLLAGVLTITGGSLGEELGWRGYALNQLEQNHSPLVASVVVGLVWGFWHLPLWFLSGFSGSSLVVYVLAFLVGIIATSILITFFYHRCRNILIAVWIHFWFNFLLKIVEIDLLPLLVSVSSVYCVVAILLVAFRWEEFHQMASDA